MARPSTVVQRIMPALMLFEEQGRRLPPTNAGKVNVSQLCNELHEIDPKVNASSDRQYLHGKEELRELVNKIAVNQGLAPIDHGADSGEATELEERLKKATKQAKEDAQAAVVATAAQGALLEELESINAELEKTRLERDAALERLRLIEEGGYLFKIS